MGGQDQAAFPGGQGFQQGGAGAVIPAIYSWYLPHIEVCCLNRIFILSRHESGGFGGGGTAHFEGSYEINLFSFSSHLFEKCVYK
jgi:hypothetical protein